MDITTSSEVTSWPHFPWRGQYHFPDH